MESLRLIWLACCVGLAGCDVAGATSMKGAAADQRIEDQSATGTIVPSDLAGVAERDFPLDGYEDYPANIRPLLQAYSVANDQCRGIPGIEQMRACNRRQLAHVELDRRGWCWGGAEVEAEKRWVPCGDEEVHQSGRVEAAGPYYSELRIQWEENRARLERGEPGVGPLPANWEALLPSTNEALSVRLDPVAASRFPLSRYRGLVAEIQPLVQRDAVFGERCRAGSGSSEADRLAACRREALVRIELERRGWCYLGPTRGWDRCVSDPNYLPGSVAATGLHLYPESYVQWWSNFERRGRRNPMDDRAG